MEIGISTASFFLRRYTEDALSRLAEWRIPCAELMLNSFSEYGAAFGKVLAERKGGVRVHSVHALGTQFEPQLYALNSRAKQDAFYWLGQLLDAAQAVGATYYTFHGFTRAKRTFREDFIRTGEGTAEIYEFCQKRGVTLCYENVEWAFYNRPGVFSRLLPHCPDLKGVLDIKQARLSGYDYRDYLAEMSGHLAHVHVSDYDENGRCLPGKGKFDFDELFRRLADIGFDGAVLIESYPDDYGAEEELIAAREFLVALAEKYKL